MGVLTRDMQRVVRERPVGFVATVSADGAPEVAPKSTVTVWDDDHLVFMEDMFSHRTVANLLRNPAVEVVVVDEVTYRAYRFTGRATILTDGPVFGRVMSFFRDRYGSQAALPRVKRIGLIKVQRRGTAQAHLRYRCVQGRRGRPVHRISRSRQAARSRRGCPVDSLAQQFRRRRRHRTRDRNSSLSGRSDATRLAG